MSDKLLYAISTRGSMPLTEFYDACTIDQVQPEYESLTARKHLTQQKNRIIRTLAALAYCEFDFSVRKVFACAPCLAALPSLQGTGAVLTGARTPYLKRSVEALVASNRDALSVLTIQFENQSAYAFFERDNSDWLPSSVFINSTKPEKLQQLATNLHIASALDSPAAIRLATFSADIEEIEETLQWEPYKHLDGWETRVFDPSASVLHFGKTEIADCALVEYTHYITQQKRHYIKLADQRAEVNRDWGRYIILAWKRINVIWYDKKLRKMAVPWTVPIPPIFARAAALCSGLPPQISQLHNKTGSTPVEVDVYADVPRSVAQSIATKLSQRIVFTRFSRRIE